MSPASEAGSLVEDGGEIYGVTGAPLPSRPRRLVDDRYPDRPRGTLFQLADGRLERRVTVTLRDADLIEDNASLTASRRNDGAGYPSGAITNTLRLNLLA